LGVGVGHMRRHVTCQRVKGDHVIHHVTCLRASEDYTSRCNLESSKIQHVISKMFREEKANSDQVDYRRVVLSERSCIHSRK